jgi:transcriptional regulator with XRE-family HTH domain
MVFVNLSAYGDSEALRALGDSIRSDRLSRNYPQKHLASLAGISLPTYRKIEQGEGTVEMRHLARVLAILGHGDRLRDLVPPITPPPDPKALASMERQRARRRSP